MGDLPKTRQAKSYVRPVPKPAREQSDTENKIMALKAANIRYNQAVSALQAARQEREMLIARLLEGVEIDPAMLELVGDVAS